MIQYPRYKRHRFSSFQVIIAGFAAVDLVGALLLMLPIAAQQRCVTPFHEALFTSTSALCVTGLVVQDTGSYWSAFGQSVILLLIQIGGLGVITVGAAFALLSGRKISLKQRSTMQEATAAPQMGGIVRLTGFILRITALFELVGAALLLPTFCADLGLHLLHLLPAGRAPRGEEGKQHHVALQVGQGDRCVVEHPDREVRGLLSDADERGFLFRWDIFGKAAR